MITSDFKHALGNTLSKKKMIPYNRLRQMDKYLDKYFDDVFLNAK